MGGAGMSSHSNLPPEQMTARHLNPDFVPRARYDAIVAEVEQLRAALAEITPAAQMLIRLNDEWFDPHPLSLGEVDAVVERASKALEAVRG